MGEPAKTLLPYLQRADELHTHDHLAAYYCRLYAMEKGLRIPVKERTSETKAILISLMSQLEKDKKVVKLSPDDNMYMEGFALKVFAKADKQDRAGRADLKTAMTFYAASIFFEVLLQFGELPPDIQEKQKYASWKAADIRKALAEGKKPVPGPPVDETNLEVDTTWGTEGTTNLAEQPTPPPKDSTFIDDRNYTQSPHEDFNLPSAPSGPISPSYNAGYPPSYPHSASTPFDSLAGSPTTSGYNSFQQDAHQQQPHWPGSLASGQPSESYQMNGSYDSEYKPSAGTIVEAHKASRFAVSALAFDDVPTAISHLRKSLELLTSSSATVD